ncbi:MAG: DNA helicase RecQ [Pseudomonadota bacterium]
MTAVPERRDDVYAALKTTFGFDGFRPGQEEIVAAMCAGADLLAVMPTGAGKSLCYQLPALMTDGLTVVVSPLIALMDNQCAQLSTLGAPAGAIHSNRPREASVADWRRAAAGELRLLYMSPERLMTPRMIGALRNLNVARFVVDEAHCVSQWGHDFRPDYYALGDLRETFPDTPFAAFTATADERTRAEIAGRLLGRAPHVFVHGFDRPNIDIAITDKYDGRNQILAHLPPDKNEQGVVYCLSRKETEEIAEFLRASGYNATAYHAGLAPEERTERLNAFLTEPDLIVAATVAFGMGIDKPDIRFVLHYAIPSSIEAYYQEIGRAGRDGEPARAVLLYAPADVARRRRMIDRDRDAPGSDGRGADGSSAGGPGAAESRRLADMVALCETVTCRRQALLAHFGETIDPCGHCDICRSPPELVDETAAARLVIRAVAESGERYGAAFLVDILRGADTEKVRERGADALSVYGAGAARKGKEWRRVVDQMVAAKLLRVEGEYNVVALAPAARQAGDDLAFEMRAPAKRTAASKSKASPGADLPPADQQLFAALKAKRLELARERDVPAYVIFSDRTLIDMAKKRPRTHADFNNVFGVGAAKTDAFADAFIAVVDEA